MAGVAVGSPILDEGSSDVGPPGLRMPHEGTQMRKGATRPGEDVDRGGELEVEGRPIGAILFDLPEEMVGQADRSQRGCSLVRADGPVVTPDQFDQGGGQAPAGSE